MQQKRNLFIAMVLILIVVRIFTTVPHFNANARVEDIPERPEPVVEPVVDTVPNVIDNESSDSGAIIILDASENVADGYWTDMQWYAADTDEWHTVNGWEGSFSQGKVQWWVGEDNFNQGPFRWRIYADQEKSTLLKTSDMFYLPKDKHHKTTVRISWP